MSDRTHISWADASWSVTRGCSRVSEGCTRCYAERMAHRFNGAGQPFEGLTDHHGKWTGKVRLVPEALDLPLHWKKPRRIFVNSMSDLFHPEVPDEFIARVWARMLECREHTFLVLTKRPERARELFTRIETGRVVKWGGHAGKPLPDDHWFKCRVWQFAWGQGSGMANTPPDVWRSGFDSIWPAPNVWLGVSAENQETADERIPILLDTPAAHRWISAEPLLGPVDLSAYVGGPYVALPGDKIEPGYNFGLSWIVAGGESGPGARPCDLEWIRSIVRQCKGTGVPAFVKQLGSNPRREYISDGAHFQAGWNRTRQRAGADLSEWPSDLRVQQFPEEMTCQE